MAVQNKEFYTLSTDVLTFMYSTQCKNEVTQKCTSGILLHNATSENPNSPCFSHFLPWSEHCPLFCFLSTIIWPVIISTV